MSVTPATDIMYLKGVGPQRAALAGQARHPHRRRPARLPPVSLRRPHPLQQNQRNCSRRNLHNSGHGRRAGAVRYTRGRGAIYHLLVRDATGIARPANFFTARTSRENFAPASASSCTARRTSIRYRPRPHRNDQSAVRDARRGDSDCSDSTEVGRIVPIYEAIGVVSSRMMRRMIHTALENSPRPRHRSAAGGDCSRATHFPRGATRLRFVHFPPPDVPLETLNAFRSPAHQRLIFEEFFFYQLSLALRRKQAAARAGHRFSRARAARFAKRSSAFCPSSPPMRRSASSRRSPPTSSAPCP